MILSDDQRDAVIALARKAAAEILAVYESEFAIEHKDDRSPLTAADLASHRCILAGLQALTPHITVQSEESKDLDNAARRAWTTLWLVDPLDGTREFIKRNGEFTVNIALVVDGVATWGVIQQPVTGALWHGGAGLGAFIRILEQDGRDAGDVAIHARTPAAAPLRIAASRSHRDARTQALLDALPGSEVVGCGSSLKFCRIADGGIDLYPRFGPTSEWDTAAGQAILEGAGGAVLDPRGRPFRYNQRETLLNGDFIALADIALRGRLPA
jgi:3'(2'), 5'-bisphosphate nucleotidase